MAEEDGDIYSATYSNVPVYELKIRGDHVMRRRSDDWINATHILKIAGFDKPARTRILEREVQKGVHEKIQGGYGKYQGTWVPLGEGRAIAEKNGVLQKLHKIFDFVPGDRSPPPAPKHQIATTARTKTAKVPVQAKRNQPANVDYYRHADNEQYDGLSAQFNDDETPVEQATPSSALLDDEQLYHLSQTSTGSRKRKRGLEDGELSQTDQEHVLYGDELLDYFVTYGDDTDATHVKPPTPPPHFNPDKSIDNHGNNALHWACSMGDIQVVRDLLSRGANPFAPTEMSGETPLIRAVLFTNNYDKKVFHKLVNLLGNTIMERDWHGATVFHHIAETARSRSKWSCARYYCEVLVTKLNEQAPGYVTTILQTQDKNHDTAVLCAVRNGCVKVATFLLTHCPEAGDIPNLKGETANELLRILSSKRQSLEIPPSSPVQPEDSLGRRQKRRTDLSKIPTVSRAASAVLTKIGPLMEEASTRLAMRYETDMKEKQILISEAQAALSGFEAQRHKVRQETYALLAKAESATNNEENENQVQTLRNLYASKLIETQSLLEQLEHSTLQSEIHAQDSATPAHLFHINNPDSPFPNPDEIRALLPWAKELNRQQARRRALVAEIASLMSTTGHPEKIDRYRKLVAIATGVKEEDLDEMSGEILESLEGSTGLSDGNGLTASEGASQVVPVMAV